MKNHAETVHAQQRMKQACKTAMVNANLHTSVARASAKNFCQKSANTKSMYFVHRLETTVRKPI